jgi:hypothetical protein
MANTGEFDLCCSGPLQVSLHRTGFWGLLRRAIPARCVRLSLTSIHLETQVAFVAGERLVLDLGVNDLRVEELLGTVRVARPLQDRDGYRVEMVLVEPRARNARHGLRHLSARGVEPRIEAGR